MMWWNAGQSGMSERFQPCDSKNLEEEDGEEEEDEQEEDEEEES
jgi:hypothetical protein